MDMPKQTGVPMTSPERELREAVAVVMKFYPVGPSTQYDGINQALWDLRGAAEAAAPAPTDCESVAGKTTEAVTQGCRAPDLPQAPAPTPPKPALDTVTNLPIGAPTPAPPTNQTSANFVAPNPNCPLCQGLGSWVEGERCGCTIPRPAVPVVPEREPPRSMWPDDLTICRKCKRDMLTNRHAVDIWGQIACLPNVSWREQCDALAAAPRAAGGQQEASLTLKQILDVLYTGRTMVNFNHVPSVTRAIDWLSQDFRDALAAAEPQVEGKT